MDTPFIHVTLRDTKQRAWVNHHQIRVILVDEQHHTRIVFDEHHQVSVVESSDEIAGWANGRSDTRR
jgi:hypothetical protein